MAGAPEFISNDQAQILNELIQDYESRTGRTLYPAQPERLVLQAMAYREVLLRSQMQFIAEQNLVRYAQGVVLDELGRLVGVSRLAPAFALTTLRFFASSSHPGIVIPAGTLVATSNGQISFRTDIELEFEPGQTVREVVATCIQEGPVGNGFIAGEVRELLNPITYITSVTNVTETIGGSDIESDDNLRERIQLAPSIYSTAGSVQSYRFHALSASPLISDVEVNSPYPGHVEVFPLMLDGSTTPVEIIDAVENALNAERVRPLTDNVIVTAPTRIDYTLTVNLVIFEGEDPQAAQQAAAESLGNYVLEQRALLGRDITRDQIIARAFTDAVYDVDVPGFTDLIVNSSSYAFNTQLTVQVVGTNPG